MFWDKYFGKKDNNVNSSVSSNQTNVENANINNQANVDAQNNLNNQEVTNKNGKTKRKKPGSFDGVRDLTKMIFKERNLKIEKREITKEDKKAAIITAIIIIGIGLLLWFLPFTHKFFEDIILLRI